MYLNRKLLARFFKVSAIQPICFLSFVFLSIIGLSACGGGNDDHSLPPATIDSSNATKAVQASVSAAFDLTEAGQLSYISNTDLLAASSRIALSRFSRAAVRYPLVPQTSSCAVGGSVIISGNVAGAGYLSAGDVIRIDAAMCDDGDVIVDGLLQMTTASIEGDISTAKFLLGLNVLFSDFTVTESGGSTIFNGDIGITLDTRISPVATVNVFGDHFTISSMGQTQSLSNFSNRYTVNSNQFPVVWTHNSQGVISSDQLSGSVSYQTPVQFAGSGANYPDRGALLITGANNATLRLITIDNVDIRIDADYDGDGNVDETLYMTWVELLE